MKLKELRLDFEALFSQVVFGHGFLHYGYWEHGRPETPSLAALGEAQMAYFDKMVAHFPDDISTVLDVGSGTGSNALLIKKMGYEIECICPSPRLNAIAREKLPDDVPIHEMMFEDFSSDKRFDLLIFPESFHYIKLLSAIEQASIYAGKYVLMFGYFRRKDSEGDDEPRGSYRQLRDVLNRFDDQFEIVTDEDVTEYITPTFYVLDEIKNNYVQPFVKKFKEGLEGDHRFYNFLFNRTLGKSYRNIQRRSVRSKTFADENEYRLILLKKL